MADQHRPPSSSEALRRLKQRTSPSAGEPTPPPRYEMLGELGRGGVGVVYRGRDVDLSREVAMKVLHPQFADNPEVLDRFVEEAQIGGQLQHPGIVPVYEVGVQADDRPFFAMKLIKGVTLWQQLSQRQRPDEHRQQFLAAFLQVCQTMAYAHARRVVHRDLKPENVMVGSFGEVQVVDWGFAKVLPADGDAGTRERPATADTDEPPKSVIETVRSQGDSGSKSMLGSVLGTPAYMPREQALGDVDHMDLRSDVFGLGGILCEILTGAPPYRGKGQEVLLQAARADLKDAHQRLDACGANAALIDLCKRCLQAAPEDRPDSAQQVADEVAAYLASVEQRARSAEVKAAEARVRARATVMLAAAALLILGLGGGGWWYVQHADAKRVADATQLASEARAAASLALGEARAGGFEDAMRWQRASDAAAQAQRLADASDVPTDERTRSTTLVATITDEAAAAAVRRAQRRKDRQMERDLAGVYAATQLAELSASKHDRQLRNSRRNAELFRAYSGVDLDTLTVEQAVEHLRPSEIRPALVAGLDNWAYSLRDVEESSQDHSGSTRLWSIARALDDGAPRREHLRSILESRDWDRDRLLHLATEADWSDMAPHDFQLLDAALAEAGLFDESVEVLRHGVEQHPQSYQLFSRLSARLAELPKPDFEGAIAAARAARAIDPTPLGEQLIASYETQLGRFDIALPKLTSLVQRFPEDSSAWNQLGLVHLAQEQIDDARRCFERAAQLADSPAALCNVGTCHYELEHDAEAERCYRAALAIQPDYANGWSNLAESLNRQGRLDEAEQAVEKALALAPELATAWVVLSGTRNRQRRFAESEAAARRCLAIDPESPLGLAALGQALRRLGRVDEALEAMAKSAEADEHDIAIHCNYAEMLADVGRAQEGIDHLEKKRAGLRDHAAIHVTTAHCQRVLGRFADAEQTLRAAIEEFPDNERTHFAFAQMVGAQGRHEEALQALRRAEELGLDTPELHSNLSACLGSLGRHEESFQEAQRAVESDPKHAPSQFNLFQATIRRGDAAGGLEHLRVAQSLWAGDPTSYGRLWHERSTQILAEVLRNLGEQEEALRVAEAAARQQPDSGAIRTLFATMLLRQGEAFRALAEFEVALQLEPANAPAWMNLASLRGQSGKLLRAQQAAHRAEELFATDDSAFARTWRQRAKEFGDELQQALDGYRELLPVARGEQPPASAEQAFAAAAAAYGLDEHLLACDAARRAFDAYPELAEHETHAYSAACFAALALAADELSPSERSTRREFCRRCLQAELDRLAALPNDDDAQRAGIAERLRHLRLDPDLEAVRADASVDAMPVDEAKAWRALWQDLDARLAALQPAAADK